MGFVAPPRQGVSKVLIVSEWQTSQRVFDQLGFTHTYIHHSQLSSAMGAATHEELLRCHFVLLWVDFPNTILAKDSETHARRWRVLRVWFETAKRTGTPAVLSGTAGPKWQYDRVKAMYRDGLFAPSTHAWCRFGVAIGPDTTKPSASKHRLYTTISLRAHPCQCPPNTDHAHDYRGAKGQDATHARRRLSAEAAFLRKLLTTLGCTPGALRVPESNCPTRNGNCSSREYQRRCDTAMPQPEC